MLGGRGDEVIIVPFIYPCGKVSVSSLDYFSSIVSSYKTSNTSLSVSFEARHKRRSHYA